jgi:tetratricopeptide (TPR) repeat protein
LAPSRALAALAFSRQEKAFESDPAEFDRSSLSYCWASIGETARADKLWPFSPQMAKVLEQPGYRPYARLQFLMFQSRFEEAVPLAESTLDAPFAPARSPKWSFVQQARARLLVWAQDTGQAGLAARMAEMVLEADAEPLREPSDPDAPVGSFSAQALSYLVQSDPAAAARWAERLDPLVRPGGPAFDVEDMVAVFRTWLALNRPERAQSIYDAMAAAPPAKDRGGVDALARLQAAQGRYDEAIRNGDSAERILLEEFVWRVDARDFEALVARAEDRRRDLLLGLCAGRANPAQFVPSYQPYLQKPPSDIALSCVRRMRAPGRIALGLADAGGPRRAAGPDAGAAGPGAAHGGRRPGLGPGHGPGPSVQGAAAGYGAHRDRGRRGARPALTRAAFPMGACAARPAAPMLRRDSQGGVMSRTIANRTCLKAAVAAAALAMFSPGPPAMAAPAEGLIGQPIEEARKNDLFVFFSLAQTGDRPCGAGRVVDFRPQAPQFRPLTGLEVALDGQGRIEAMSLVLNRSFIDTPAIGMFARDIAESFLRDAAGPADAQVAGLVTELNLSAPAGTETHWPHGAPPPPAGSPTPCLNAFLGAGANCAVKSDRIALAVDAVRVKDAPAVQLVIAAPGAHPDQCLRPDIAP